jgi:hypothetical protein
MQALWIGHDTQRFQELVQVEQWLACSHRDEVCSPRRFHAGAVSVIECDLNLLDDFARS